jgi:hypothetical protein
MFSSCAIHNKFPYICLLPSCIKQQYSLKPLKKRIQIAISGKKRKMNASQSDSKNRKNNSSNSPDYHSKKNELTDNTIKDSIIDKKVLLSLSLMDTVIRIYYLDLTDSIIDKNKAIIKSYVTRTGVNKISEISLTDFYSEVESDKHKSISLKADLGKYLLDIGVSKHRLFWRKNNHFRHDKSKKIVYLEIRFH